MDREKINYGLIVTVMVTILGWGVTFGVCQNKIDNNTSRIERIEQNQSADRVTLQQISSQLAGLNAKMDLLLDGRIVTMKE